MGRLVSCAAIGVLVGCAKPRPTDGAVATGESKGEQAVIRALSVREPAPDCEAVEALVANPVATLTAVATDVPHPPWVGLRAATCLTLGHAEVAQDTLRDWVSDAETGGLARIVLQAVDDMPEHVAEEVLRDALAGPHAAAATDAAAGSDRPALRSLLGGETAQ